MRTVYVRESENGHKGRPRAENVAAVFNVVLSHRVVTRSDIVRVTGLSLPTVTRVVAYLMGRGLLRQVRYMHGGLGRRPGIVELEPSSAHVVGVDVGEISIRAALADITGNILATSKRPTNGKEGVREVLGRVADAIHEVSQKTGARPSVIVVGYPGLVDENRGTVRAAPFIAGSEGFGVGDALQQMFPKTVIVVQNDVNLAALGECWRGAAREFRHQGTVVFLSFRTGIGAGIVSNGRLYRGARGGAGEVGYLCGDPSFKLAGVGSPGWVETQAGGEAVVELYIRRRCGKLGTPDLRRETLNLEDVVDAYRSGDPDAEGVMCGALEHFGLVLANVAAVLDPDLVVLGGVFTALGPRGLEKVVSVANTKIPWLPEVRLSELGLEATLYGAVDQALMVAIELAKAQTAGLPPTHELPRPAWDRAAWLKGVG